MISNTNSNSNSNFKIIKKSEHIYAIELKKHDKNEILLRSLTQLSGLTISATFEMFQFHATNAETLSDFLSRHADKRNKYKIPYTDVSNLLRNISRQIIALQHHTFYNLSLENILVVTNKTSRVFIYLGTHEILPINDDETITFYTPFSLNMPFLSPEIKELSKLPSSVGHKSVYYSLGALAMYCFLMEETEYDLNELNGIINTGVYWFIENCMRELPNKRVFL